MKQWWGWLLVLLLGALVGSLGPGARPQPTAAREAALLRQLNRGEEQLLASARAASNAGPENFRAASAYAVRLLRVLEQKRLLLPPVIDDAQEAELPNVLHRCEMAARSPEEQSIAEGLRVRTTALLQGSAPDAATVDRG